MDKEPLPEAKLLKLIKEGAKAQNPSQPTAESDPVPKEPPVSRGAAFIKHIKIEHPVRFLNVALSFLLAIIVIGLLYSLVSRKAPLVDIAEITRVEEKAAVPTEQIPGVPPQEEMPIAQPSLAGRPGTTPVQGRQAGRGAISAASPEEEPLPRRDLFRTEGGKEAAPAQEAKESAASFTLTGILHEPQLTAIIEDTKTGKTYFLSVGDPIDSFTVKEITPDRVILTGPEGAEYTLVM